jgi:hypothetical protein
LPGLREDHVEREQDRIAGHEADAAKSPFTNSVPPDAASNRPATVTVPAPVAVRVPTTRYVSFVVVVVCCVLVPTVWSVPADVVRSTSFSTVVGPSVVSVAGGRLHAGAPADVQRLGAGALERLVMIPLPLLTTSVAMGYFSLSFCLSAHMARLSGFRW